MKLTVIILFIIILILIVYIFLEKQKIKNILKNLNKMLTLAIEDNFSEENFDESLLSSIESKFYQFILSNQRSKKLLIQDKININKLISDISHQTKTPLSNIMIYTELLKDLENNSQYSEYLDALSSQVSKLKFLIEALIKSSRLEAGIIKINSKKNSTQELVEITIQNAMKQADLKTIKIINNTNDYKAIFDMKWTNEALFNILDNAIKYSDNNSRVIIESVDYEFFICIKINDSGIGVSEDEITNIFERFYRSSKVAEIEGVGIGLYLAREIISAQSGYIKVNHNPDKGSVFSVYLPKKA